MNGKLNGIRNTLEIIVGCSNNLNASLLVTIAGSTEKPNGSN